MPVHVQPYRWSGHSPRVRVERAVEGRVLSSIRAGRDAVLVGARGMGKSVALRAADTALSADGWRVVRFDGPPADATVAACQRRLADALSLADNDPDALIRRFLDGADGAAGVNGLCLMYDEIEKYPDGVRRPWLDALATIGRGEPRFRVVAAGGVATYLLDHIAGSTFTSRADRHLLSPFSLAELAQLVAGASEDEWLAASEVDAVYSLSGGHPALCTYALESLWNTSPDVRPVAEIFHVFQRDQREFLRQYAAHTRHASLSDAPERLMSAIEAHEGAVPVSVLIAVTAGCSLPWDQLLDLYLASGLLVWSQDPTVDPVPISLIPSVLPRPARVEEGSADPAERLRVDLLSPLGTVHLSAPDFFHRRVTGAGRAEYGLVPEATFTVVLRAALEARGWTAERETLLRAGRTDLKVERVGHEGNAIIEVKIWGRNDYETAHNQVCSYAGAESWGVHVVMIADRAVTEEEYEAAVLTGQMFDRRTPPNLLAGAWRVAGTSQDGAALHVEHWLVRVPRR